MQPQNLPGQRGFPPVVIHFTDAVGLEDFSASSGDEKYERLDLLKRASLEEKVMNLLRDGQNLKALQELTRAIDRLGDRPSIQVFHRTMSLAVHALQLLEAGGDKANASILRHALPLYKIDHEKRYVPANQNAPQPAPPRPQ